MLRAPGTCGLRAPGSRGLQVGTCGLRAPGTRGLPVGTWGLRAPGLGSTGGDLGSAGEPWGRPSAAARRQARAESVPFRAILLTSRASSRHVHIQKALYGFLPPSQRDGSRGLGRGPSGSWADAVTEGGVGSPTGRRVTFSILFRQMS